MPDNKVFFHDGMRISSAPIRGGFVVWSDNVRPLMDLRTRLNENKLEMEKNKKKLRGCLSCTEEAV